MEIFYIWKLFLHELIQCAFSSQFFVKFDRQVSTFNVFPPWTDSIYSFNLPFCVKYDKVLNSPFIKILRKEISLCHEIKENFLYVTFDCFSYRESCWFCIKLHFAFSIIRYKKITSLMWMTLFECRPDCWIRLKKTFNLQCN